MKKLYKRTLLLCGLMLAVIAAKAQDPQFTQYYNAPSYLNPAFTGALGEQLVGAVNYRRQWSSLGSAHNTFAASFDFATADRIAFGVQFLNDEAGQAGFKTTGTSLIGSYLIPLSGGWNLQPAVQMSYFQRSINFDKLVFVDEILFDNSIAAEGTGESVSYMNFTTGLLLYSNRVWFGLSAHNFAKPVVLGGNETLFTNENIAQRQTKYSVHAGYNVPLPNPDYGTFGSALYKKQGPAQQFDMTLGLNYKEFSLGGGFRSFVDFEPNTTSRDALAVIVGYNNYYRNYNYNISYSYDLTISGLSQYSGGSHEISLLMKLSSDHWLDVADKRRVFCPVVNRNIFMLKTSGKKVKNTHNRKNDRGGRKFNKRKKNKRPKGYR